MRQRNGPQLAQKPLAGDAVAGDRPRLDQRGALPILADAFVIGDRRRDRHRRRRRARVGAQPQIGAENIAVAGALLEHAHKIAREPAEEGLGAVARVDPRSRRIEKQDQVDIARIVELAGAELAHAEHDQPAIVLRIGRVREHDPAFCSGLAQQMAQRCTDRRFGKAAERCGLLFERPGAGKLGDRGQQRGAAFGDAQPPHQRRGVLAVVDRVIDRLYDPSEKRIRSIFDQSGQKLPLSDREPAKKGRVAKNRCQQPFARRRTAPVTCSRSSGSRFDGQRRPPGFEAERETPLICRPRQLTVIKGKPLQKFHLPICDYQGPETFR